MLHRQLGREKVRFAPSDRVFLAALLHQFPPKVLRKLRLLVRPAPERACSTWAEFLRSPAHALLACDFFKTVTLSGARMYPRLIGLLAATTVRGASHHAHAEVRFLSSSRHDPHHAAATVDHIVAAVVTTAGRIVALPISGVRFCIRVQSASSLNCARTATQ
jgi:hypothetical protein